MWEFNQVLIRDAASALVRPLRLPSLSNFMTFCRTTDFPDLECPQATEFIRCPSCSGGDPEGG